MNQFHFLILGNESRQLYLKELLEQEGHIVTLSLEYIDGDYDAFLLPVPSSAKYFAMIEDKLKSGQYVFGCNLPQYNRDLLRAMQAGRAEGEVHIVEYMKSDSVAYKNAIATAEGAIAQAIKSSDVNLHGSRSLVTGYGRCGEILAEKLKGLNSQVTIMDRKPEKRARAYAHGFQTLDFSLKNRKTIRNTSYDFVFNTVPHMVIGAEMLSCFPKEVVILDIASRPGGVDFDYCSKNGIKAELLPGIPGKYAPKTSAKILLEVIEESMCGSEV